MRGVRGRIDVRGGIWVMFRFRVWAIAVSRVRPMLGPSNGLRVGFDANPQSDPKPNLNIVA